MFNQAVVRTGIKFGLFGALAGFVIILLLYFAGVNPYGQLSWWSLLPIPVFIFWGLNVYKKSSEADLGFLQAFIAGMAITFFLALFSAIFLYIFGAIAGPEVLQTHIGEMKALLGQTSAEAVKANVLSQETIAETYRKIESTTLADLALDVFVKKVFIGFLFSIIGAVFFRK